MGPRPDRCRSSISTFLGLFQSAQRQPLLNVQTGADAQSGVRVQVDMPRAGTRQRNQLCRPTGSTLAIAASGPEGRHSPRSGFGPSDSNIQCCSVWVPDVAHTCEWSHTHRAGREPWTKAQSASSSAHTPPTHPSLCALARMQTFGPLRSHSPRSTSPAWSSTRARASHFSDTSRLLQTST